jgi:mRNA-degrading endonuclease RelE of RelBE toxin-antitoxin system
MEWSQAARASAHQYISDQDGDYRRLKVGGYRIMYVVEVDVITIERVDRVI